MKMCSSHLCVLYILIFLLLNKIHCFPTYNYSAFMLHLTTKSRRMHCFCPHVGETLLLSISEHWYLKERERVNVHLDFFFLCARLWPSKPGTTQAQGKMLSINFVSLIRIRHGFCYALKYIYM